MFDKLMARMDERGDLMGRMMEKRGVALDRASPQAVAQAMRAGASACMRCGGVDVCKEWLEDPEADAAGHREFCPNSRRFDALEG